MADITLNAPGTTNNPYTPAGFLTSVGSSLAIATTATGIHAAAAGDFSEFVHDANYGSTIVVTATVISGGTSNGDEIWLGPVVRTGANAGGGFGVVVAAFGATIGWWTGVSASLGGFTAISSSTSITRANNDIWAVTSVVSAGTATISATQNGGAISFNVNTNTHFTGESSLAAGLGFNAQNTNALFISQFTGTGVLVQTPIPIMGSFIGAFQ